MPITLSAGADPRAISIASKIEVISSSNEFGVTVAVVASVPSYSEPEVRRPKVAIVAATTSGRLLANSVLMGGEGNSEFQLTAELVAALEYARGHRGKFRR